MTELLNINNFLTPRDKLMCIVKCCKIIFSKHECLLLNLSRCIAIGEQGNCKCRCVPPSAHIRHSGANTERISNIICRKQILLTFGPMLSTSKHFVTVNCSLNRGILCKIEPSLRAYLIFKPNRSAIWLENYISPQTWFYFRIVCLLILLLFCNV